MSMNELIGTPRLPEPELDEPWVREIAGGGYEYRCWMCKQWHDWDRSILTVRKVDGKRKIICVDCRAYYKISETTLIPESLHPWNNIPDLTEDPIDSMEPLAMGVGWLRPRNQQNEGGQHGAF